MCERKLADLNFLKVTRIHAWVDDLRLIFSIKVIDDCRRKGIDISNLFIRPCLFLCADLPAWVQKWLARGKHWGVAYVIFLFLLINHHAVEFQIHRTKVWFILGFLPFLCFKALKHYRVVWYVQIQWYLTPGSCFGPRAINHFIALNFGSDLFVVLIVIALSLDRFMRDRSRAKKSHNYKLQKIYFLGNLEMSIYHCL